VIPRLEGRTGSTAITVQEALCVFLMARAMPDTVPPVPAPPMKTSTLPDDGRADVEGVDMMASMISGPVDNS
jgi:hypothetical protein